MARVPANEAVALLVFAKTPLAGRVKTRLVPALGAEGAARLYERMVRKTLSTAVEARAGDVQLWCSPTSQHGLFHELCELYRIPLFTQRGGHLGERMRNALDLALVGARPAVLMGTDCPDLTAQDVRHAAQALTQGWDAVLGPAADGGYVLVGLRSSVPELFENMAWGTASVLDETRQVLRGLGKRWHELPVRHDIDRPEDLRWLPSDWR